MATTVSITIGIPTHNPPTDLFDELIERLLHQSYHDYEILIVDDSDNDFPVHLKSLAEGNQRIRLVFKEKGRGIYDARTAIIKHANGRYLAFVDSDDMVPANYLESLVQALPEETPEESIVFCKYLFFQDNPPSYIAGEPTDKVYDSDLLHHALSGDFGHMIWARLIPVNLLTNVVCIPEYGADDAQIVPQICERAKSVIRTNRTVYFYRQRSGSLQHVNNGLLHRSYLTFCMYRDIANDRSPESLARVEVFRALAAFKLSCVDYGDEFSSKQLRGFAKKLRIALRSCKLKNFKAEKKQLVLAAYCPHIYRRLYLKKRAKSVA